MLELPESQTIARQLTEQFAGQTIRQVEAGHTPHGFTFFNEDTSQFPPLLTGRVIERAVAFGGWVELQLSGDLRLTLMDGVNARYLAAGAKEPAKHQFLLRCAAGDGFYCTVQMYGGISVFAAGSYDNPYYTAAQEKPSPLSEAFDEAYFAQLCRETPDKLSVKALLATEQRIPGLGNGCAQDICFWAGLNPQSKLAALPTGALDRLYGVLKRTLAQMTAQGGRDTEKDLFGQPGGYRTQLSNKTWKEPCPACGGAIQRKAFLGGNVYFCETCQPLLK